jgi:hypothetical protein
MVTGRFYCQGIGDCHLLSFPKPDGGVFRVLIDCGIHTSIPDGAKKIDAIVDDIIASTGPDNIIDVVVGTHEHWDHNSGFLTSAGKFAKLNVKEVWLAWTEDPKDAQAKRLDKFKGQALTALQDGQRRLSHAAAGVSDPRRRSNLLSLANGIEGLLGFNFGLKGERSRSARDAVVALAPDNVRYLEPADDPIVKPEMPNLRIYVLGPPRDEKLLGIRERASEMYGVEAVGWPEALAMASALAADTGEAEGDTFVTPFEPELGFRLSDILERSTQPCPPAGEPSEVAFLRRRYSAAAEDWRRIDHDWLSIGADLALQLDDRTNNTSLVLAFEFVDTGRVLLFAADAQIGNWLSWQHVKWTVAGKNVTGPDLLARTVFYKVGHHGSHNATPAGKGLKLMNSKDLSAFIPTNQDDAKKVKWGQMPFEAIITDLQLRAASRVIRADDLWVKDATKAVPFATPSGSILGLRRNQGLWVELDLG